MLKDYPKHVLLKDETVVTLRPMSQTDGREPIGFSRRGPTSLGN